MGDRRMARADLFTGAVLFVLAVAVIYGAWTMDRLELRQIHPLSAPGLLPGLLGFALALCSILLVAQAVTARPRIEQPADAPDSAKADPSAFGRLVLAAGLCLIYSLGLVGRLPFWLATTLFVTVFIAVFEWDRGGGRTRRLVRLGWAIFLGLATGLAVSYAFRDLFLVRLP